jgi:hypothetical protein
MEGKNSSYQIQMSIMVEGTKPERRREKIDRLRVGRPTDGDGGRGTGGCYCIKYKQRWDGVKIAVSSTGNKYIETRCIKYKRFFFLKLLLYQIQATPSRGDGGGRRKRCSQNSNLKKKGGLEDDII